MTKKCEAVYARVCEIDEIILKLEEEKEKLLENLTRKEYWDFEHLIMTDGKTHII